MLSVRNANISLGTNGGKKCIRVAITFHTGSPCTSERNGILLNNHFLECAFPINSRTPAVWRNKRADNGRVNSDKACLVRCGSRSAHFYFPQAAGRETESSASSRRGVSTRGPASFANTYLAYIPSSVERDVRARFRARAYRRGIRRIIAG